MNNRRTVLGLLAGAALTLCLSLPAFAPAAVAAEASPARKALEVSISRVLDCIKNPDYVNPATRPPLRRQIEDEVYHIFDFGEFSSGYHRHQRQGQGIFRRPEKELQQCLRRPAADHLSEQGGRL